MVIMNKYIYFPLFVALLLFFATDVVFAGTFSDLWDQALYEYALEAERMKERGELNWVENVQFTIVYITLYFIILISTAWVSEKLSGILVLLMYLSFLYSFVEYDYIMMALISAGTLPHLWEIFYEGHGSSNDVNQPKGSKNSNGSIGIVANEEYVRYVTEISFKKFKKDALVSVAGHIGANLDNKDTKEVIINKILDEFKIGVDNGLYSGWDDVHSKIIDIEDMYKVLRKEGLDGDFDKLINNGGR